MALHRIPPSPEVLSSLHDDFLSVGEPAGLSFAQYLATIGFGNDAHVHHGRDDGVVDTPHGGGVGPELVRVPSVPVTGRLKVKVLLVDFDDRPGTTSKSHYESLLFSKGTHATGSMRDYFAEVSLGQVDVVGDVDGWIRLPHPYSYYTNNESGTGDHSYPRNARRMAEDAVAAALALGVEFGADLDAFGAGSVTALFIVHAGVGAEVQRDADLRDGNIWSHKWSMVRPVRISADLRASIYLTVPHDARLGVCAHELGHLAFQWDDFYDPNYASDNKAWDGSGDWDLMAGGSYNGNSRTPAHPVGVHKAQHGWIATKRINSSTPLSLAPFTSDFGEVAIVRSPRYSATQYLLLENRTRFGFDSELPGEGLLVWKVDESREMNAPDAPALQLVEADGRLDLTRTRDSNAGDSGDPFPGSSGRTRLTDRGGISTTFPFGDRSGVVLENIARDPDSGNITLDVVVDGVPVSNPTEKLLSLESAEEMWIPDDDPTGIESVLVVDEVGAVRSVEVGVEIEHTYIGDLLIELVAPSGVTIGLHEMQGGSARNLLRRFHLGNTPELAGLVDSSASGPWRLRVSDRQFRDRGRLVRWHLSLALAQADPVVELQSSPGLPIPDDDPTGISDVLEVARWGVVRSLQVVVAIEHPYRGDLRVELVSPGGATALLVDQSGGGQDDVNLVMDSSSAPQLATIVGTGSRGSWVLRVSDLLGEDTGELVSWGIRLLLGSDQEEVARTEEPNLVIPDADPAGISRALRFSERGVVQTLRLDLDIRHSYIGDLRVELIAPSGMRAVVHDTAGGRTADLRVSASSSDDEWPSLRAFQGQSLAGDWVLRVVDTEGFDEGVLVSWGLTAAYVALEGQ